MPIKCYFCELRVADDSSAINAGWYPSFWRGDKDCILHPFCPQCFSAYCEIDADGEIVERQTDTPVIVNATASPCEWEKV